LRREKSTVFIFTMNTISILMTGRIVIIVTSNINVDTTTCKFMSTNKLVMYTHTHTHTYPYRTLSAVCLHSNLYL
jgi:hypothetical protein